MTEGRDFWWDEEAEKVPSYCPCEPVGAEDPLFILYVSTCFGFHLVPFRVSFGATPLSRLRLASFADSPRRPLDPPVNPKEWSTRPLDTYSEPSYP